MALQIDDQIESACSHFAQERYERPWRTTAIVNDDIVEPSMPPKYRLRFGFDRPGEMRSRPRTPNPAEQRQCPYHVAN